MKIYEHEGKYVCPDCTKTYLDYERHPFWPPTVTDNPVYLVKRNGKFGAFLGCPNFPSCKYSMSIPKAPEVWIDDPYWD